MNLFIPVVGTLITLEKDWEFEIKSGYKNYKLWDAAFPNIPNYSQSSRKFAFLRGSVLKIEGITISKHTYRNSVTLSVAYDAREEIKKKIRFYVSIADVNNIVYELGDRRA